MKESTKRAIVLKIHLAISAMVVIPAAIIYGFFPDSLVELSPSTNDEHSFYKAVMGVYLGFAMLWLFGIFNNKYLKFALVSNVVFMLGLALGRLVSMLIDGVPNPPYLYGMIAELFLGFYGLWVLTGPAKRFIKNH